MDAARDPADSLGLDADVVAVGRREIERIKAELGRRSARARPVHGEPTVVPARSLPPADGMSADRMAAEMAAAAERDHLVERVRALEAEVARLRDAMATILETAARGVRPPEHR
jgi:uncharacterized small protein (DUF1192 family)